MMPWPLTGLCTAAKAMRPGGLHAMASKQGICGLVLGCPKDSSMKSHSFIQVKAFQGACILFCVVLRSCA